MDTVARIEDASCYGWCKLAAACGHALMVPGWIQLLFGHETGHRLDCLLGCQGSSQLRMLTKWFSSTRLETRTKESNIYASLWVIETLGRNESKGR